MTSVALTAFFTIAVTVIALTVFGVITAVINDYYNYKDLQRRIKAGRRKKQTKREESR